MAKSTKPIIKSSNVTPVPGGPGPRRLIGAVTALAIWFAAPGLGAADRAAAIGHAAGSPSLVRIGIAPGAWVAVNHDDATAAISAWAKTIVKARGILLGVETRTFEPEEDLAAILASHRVDALAMTSVQFLGLEPSLQPESVFLATKSGLIAEQYVLLVHENSGIIDLAGLPGRTLLLHASPRTSLAPYWIEVLLANHSLASANEVFKKQESFDTASKAILPVFFRKADACLVTTNAFELACELNPQLARHLRVLAVSRPLIPDLFCFRPDYNPEAREKLEPAILDLQESSAGRQVLTVFKCDRMVKRPVSCLDGTKSLLAEYQRAKERPNKARDSVHP